jgi:uncharacterized protein YceK
MVMRKVFRIFAVLLLLAGCASAPKTTYINNEAIPGKTYTLTSTASQVSATALFYALAPIKDLDGSVNTPFYLALNENLKFSKSDIEGLYSRIAITNPTKTSYNVKCNVAITYSDGTVEGKILLIGRSALEQRTFTAAIPVPPNMFKASYFLLLENDKGQELMRIGTFKYEVSFPHVTSR